MSFEDHFSTIARRYAEYRPTYPQALADALAELAPARDLAWDAGCGNGQMSRLLANRFARVVATDPSQEQLDAATPHPRIEYRRARAEDPVLAAASVDLAIAAQAAHWFDWPSYIAELARVTRPGSIVALVCYRVLEVDPAVNELVQRYYVDDVGPYWPKGRDQIEKGYSDLVLPWPAIEMPPIPMTAPWTRDELLGYLATWSATVKHMADKGPAAYERLTANMTAIWPDNEPRTMTWPTTLKVARVS